MWTQAERNCQVLKIQAWLEEHQTSASRARLLFEQATLLAASGEHENAIAIYNKALQFKSGQCHDFYYSRAFSFDKLGRYEEAIASYDEALQLKSDWVEAWFNRGLLLNELGRYEEAIASYDKALQFSPDFQDAWHNREHALRNLGIQN
ncbi:TPR repeat [Leptolyngbya sp. NIES-2104]|nr:TPR repeat [Leptolyngbya sp. NIES-2104]